MSTNTPYPSTAKTSSGAGADGVFGRVLASFAQVNFRSRRWIGVGITAFMILGFYGLAVLQTNRLANVRWMTGFTVLTCVVLLVLLGIRKRLPVLPLGSVSVWTQVHLYLGLFSIAAYVMHAPAIIAGGRLEFLLSLSFVGVSCSGLLGIYLSRTIPKRLTVTEGQHRFDQVSWHRHQLADEANRILEKMGESSSGVLVQRHYEEHLREFFERRAGLAFMLWPTKSRRRRLLNGLRELNRYLDSESKESLAQLTALIRHRDDVDFQFALQFRLRAWVVVHSVGALGLLVLGFIHAAVAIRFTS